ncbi:MAG: hypothetical protein JJE23_05215 [Thermoleophilia bacterium]|jgi:hypothetical protein|nr:hypothetical protein [Thermoleophilia bacterium]
MSLLPFAQLDLPGSFPLADGRYVARPAREPEAQPDVLVVRTLGAARARSRLKRGRPVPLEREPEALPLQLSRLTLIKALPFDDQASAEEWLQRVGADHEIAGKLAAEAAHTVNRALLAHRVAAPDPYAADIHPDNAVFIRFGYGSGEEVADGRWSEAVEMPEGRRRAMRTATMDGVGASERVASVLSARDTVLAHEALLVEAELAAGEDRLALAALALAAAIESLLRAGGDDGGAAETAGKLRERALSGAEIDPEALREALREARRAIRAH